MVFLAFVVQNTKPALGHLPWREKISRLDIPGTLVFLPSIVCLLLALQWGGQQYSWHDGRIIALLTVFAVLFVAFVAIQIWRQEAATVPPRILKQRTIAAGTFYSFCLGSSFFLIVYYLSVWFQAIKGDSAIRSGLSTLPFILSLVVASILSGVLVSRIGYYNPSLLASIVLAPIGAGLFTMFTPSTTHPFWIGVQVLYGFGVGLGLQQTNVAAQTVLDKKDAPTGISVVFFGQGLGGTVSVAVGQNLLDQKLISGISKIANIRPESVVDAGATNLRNVFSAQQLPLVLKAYNNALVTVFYVALGFSCASIFGALAVEWKSVKKAKAPKPEEKEKKLELEAQTEPV